MVRGSGEPELVHIVSSQALMAWRLINETLYKTDSQHAHEMMRQDPKVYDEVSVFLTTQFPLFLTLLVPYRVSAPSAVVAN
jgi:hypothetical protein